MRFYSHFNKAIAAVTIVFAYLKGMIILVKALRLD